MKKFFKILLYTLGGLIFIVLILAFVLWIKSPGVADPITDKSGNIIPGSISSIEKVTLGGIDQYMIIRGADSTKPVMLYLHGGPGSPEISFLKETNTKLENDFVMVYWEQRGAGKSYSEELPAESMNISQLISDTKELSEILAKRFKHQKIYLMGHSWGSLLGILTAYKYPELYHAYFGIGQVCFQYQGEKISYEWAKEMANKMNNKKAIKALSSISFPDSTASVESWGKYLMVERNWVNKLGGGITREKSGMWPVVKMVLNAEEYTFKEKMNFMPASLFSLEHLWPDVINTNLSSKIDSMQLPVYIFQGKYDYQTPYSLAREFFDQLKAPQKEFFTFENSAHSPNMEEVDKFNSIVRSKIVE